MFKTRILVAVCMILLISKPSFGNKFDQRLFDEIITFFLEDVRESRILIIGEGKGKYSSFFNPYVQICHEVIENPLISPEETIGIPYNVSNWENKQDIKYGILEINNYYERFQMYFLYDWSICLESGPKLGQCFDEIFENLAMHNQRGVIVLKPDNSAIIKENFEKVGFEIDHIVQSKLRKQANLNKYKNLLVFRNQNPRIFYFSFPRSGNNWLNYALNAMTGRPRVAGGNKYRFSGTNFNRSDPIIHTHIPSYIPGKNPDPEKDVLMLIVRNPFECMLRHFGYKPLGWLISNKKNEYFEGLSLFHSWNPKNRILIYYEDLMLDFENEMKRLLGFLKEKEESLEDFMAHYEEHRNSMLERYDRSHGSASKGIDMLFHSKKMPFEYLKRMDNHMKKTYPILWEEYLSRYDLKNMGD